jgi:hypothetical protein
LIFFTLASGALLTLVVEHNELRIGADSTIYLAVADAIRDGSSTVALLAFSSNLVGPVAIALALKYAALIALFNYFLFLLSIRSARALGFNFCLFALLLALDPETLPSVVTLNKEVLGMFGFVLLIRYEYSERHSKLLLLLSLFFGMMARWEQVAISIMFVILRRGIFRRHPWLSLLLVAVGISIGWPFMLAHMDLSGFTDQAAGAGLILRLNNIQAHGGYLLVLIPKMLLETFGYVTTPWYFLGAFWNEDFTDWQNQFFINLHSVAMLFMCGWFVLRKKVDVKQPIPFLVLLYLIVTTTNTFVMPRYGYPAYALLAMEAARISVVSKNANNRASACRD